MKPHCHICCCCSKCSLEERTELSLHEHLLTHLNVCLFTNKVRSGILADGTSNQIKAEVREFLQHQGWPATNS